MRTEIRAKSAAGIVLLGWVLAFLSAGACGAVRAQDLEKSNATQAAQPATQMTKGLVLKNKAPVNKEILNVKLPRPREVTLKNGLRVALLEHHRSPTFVMRMVFMSGGLSDPPDRRGLAQHTATLLREGTTNRTSRQIAEQLDSLGTILFGNAGTSSFISFVTASGQAEKFDQILEIFTDVIRNPSFPADELAKYLARTISQYEVMKSDPDFLAAERFNQALYGGHPASLIVPPIDALKKTTPAELARFHATHYRPNNAVLLIVGDVTLTELLPKIERAFGDWKSAPVPKTATPPVPAQPAARIHLVDRPDSVQTVIHLGNLAIERKHPDYFSLLLMDRIIGGPSGRLFNNLREDKGYTYGVGSYFTGSNYPGFWLATSSVRTEVTEDAMREFLYEFKRMREEQVTPEELENAKRSLTGKFALSLELPQALLQNIFTQKIFDLPDDYWDTYSSKVSSISREDIQAAARKYINLRDLQVVAVGDASKIHRALEKYGAVETSGGKQAGVK